MRDCYRPSQGDEPTTEQIEHDWWEMVRSLAVGDHVRITEGSCAGTCGVIVASGLSLPTRRVHRCCPRSGEAAIILPGPLGASLVRESACDLDDAWAMFVPRSWA